ncbi:VOC family protein [Micromonospora sp. PLK6-60]|uniref:VOC family protein n=1 Tax=Micromonospora sp. PLK6-60 TaxID=2873383 RepID=UPI001CA78731|nr:VOC family protein [Micromonospora sp. PLK6-60]MBY8874945.1 VOC family protein [Micromonospora sp. PLK6-60]
MTQDQHTARPAVRQLRLVVEAEDYDAAVRFFRDVLGLPEQAAFSGGDGARVVILDAGRATLELANPAQKRMIDEVEVGRQVAPRIRVAFEVDDATTVTGRLVEAGATEVAPPTVTPWQSLNSRLDAPAGLQITVFQELTDLDGRSTLDGFGTDG